MLKAAFLATLVKWLTRRGLELGGLLTLVASVDPTVLQNLAKTIGAILTGDFASVNLASVISIFSVVGGLIWNGASTFSNHATTDGAQVQTNQMPTAQKTEVKEAVAVTIKKRPTFLDQLFNRKALGAK